MVKANDVLIPGLTVPKPDRVLGKMIAGRPATVVVTAPGGIVWIWTPAENVTVPPTLLAGKPPILLNTTKPDTTELAETAEGAVT